MGGMNLKIRHLEPLVSRLEGPGLGGLMMMITSGIVNRITGIGYLVRTGSEPVRTSTYQVQTGTGNV